MSLVWLDRGLNPGLPNHLQTLYSFGPWPGFITDYTFSLLSLFILFHSLWVFHTSVHWSVRGSRSPQVSRTLLSILVDPDNAVVWRVLIFSLISNSLTFHSKHSVTFIKCTNYYWYHCHLYVPRAFLALQARSKYFTLWSGKTTKILKMTRVFLLVYWYLVWPSMQDWVIRLFLKIPENFMRLILKDGGPASLGCRIHRLYLCRRVRFPKRR